MAVRLRSDRHPLFGPGFALLVFDRPVDTPRLDISILNIVTGLYLGPSAPGRPNWVKQQTTFFPAIRAGGQGSSVFRVGPEVTTYIQEGTYVEIASADGSVREESPWEGILLRSSPVGTEGWADRAEAFELGSEGPAVDAGPPRTDALDKARRDEQAAIQREHREEDRIRAELAVAVTALAKQQVEEDARRRAEEEAATQRVQEEAILRRKQEEEQLRAERASAAAAQARQQAEEDARRRAEEAAAAQRAQEEAIRREQQEERARTEQAAEAAALARQQAAKEARRQAEEAAAIQRTNEAERTVPATSARASDEPGARGEDQAPLESLEQDSKRPGKRSILALATLVAAAIGGPILTFAALAAVVLGLQEISNPGHLCWRFEVFCSPKAETTNAPTQSAAAPPIEIAPPPITPAPIAPRPAAEQPSDDDCTAKAMGTYSRPTDDRILEYIRAHEEKRNSPDTDLDRIARYFCFADKDDYTRSYFAIAAAAARRDQSLSFDLLVEFDAEIARTIKPSDDPTLLPSNSQQPPKADSSRPSAAGAPRRRR